jgi:hypothetical protein
LRLRSVLTSSPGRARHFSDFFAGRSLPQSPSRMSLSAPQPARPSPSHSVPGESESTSGVKFVVLEIEIDQYVRVRVGNESWVIAAFLNKESDWYFYQSPSSGLLTIYYFR